MCGGPGSRLDAPVEKPLFEVGGRPMVDRVAGALVESRIGTTYAVVSPRASATREHVRDRLDLPTIETPGDGYVPDLGAALDRPAVDRPVLTVAADLPLLAGDVVDAALDVHASLDPTGASMAVCVPAALKRLLGTSVEESTERNGRELAPTGLNVVGAGVNREGTGDETTDRTHVSYDARLAVNVNRPGDAEVAEVFL